MNFVKTVMCIFVFSLFYCFVSGFSSEIGDQSMWNLTHSDRLRHDLLLNYDKFSRPMQHYNTTRLHLGLDIQHIEFQEFKSTLTVHCWLKMVWNDEKLKWNASNYENLSVLRLAVHELWQPDIYLYNSPVSTSISQYGNTYTLVYPTGEVLWVPPVQLSVLCELNLKYWPFDTQECYLMFGSWTHHAEQIELLNYNNKTDVEHNLLNGSEWKIVRAVQTTVKRVYDCCPDDAYPHVFVNLTLSRISTSYKTVIVTPALVVIFLTLWTFWLPPQASEKIVINACTAVIVTMFLLYFTQKLPIMGAHTPRIVVFYSHSLFIVGYSMLESVTVITLTKMNQSKPLPWAIKKPLTGVFGQLLGLDGYIKQTATPSHRIIEEEMRDQQANNFDSSCNNEDNDMKSYSSSNKGSFHQDWILLAAAIDRIFFIFYSFQFIILYFVYDL